MVEEETEKNEIVGAGAVFASSSTVPALAKSRTNPGRCER
jgi:hypothetical protein